MANFFSSLFSSAGIKRKIVAWLNTILGIVYAFPALALALQSDISVISTIIAALGGVAVGQAAVKGTVTGSAVTETVAGTKGVVVDTKKTVTKYTLLSLSSLLAIVIGIAQFVPGLSQYIPSLVRLAGMLGAIAAGTTLNASTKDDGKASS